MKKQKRKIRFNRTAFVLGLITGTANFILGFSPFSWKFYFNAGLILGVFLIGILTDVELKE